MVIKSDIWRFFLFQANALLQRLLYQALLQDWALHHGNLVWILLVQDRLQTEN